ncbi:MAG: hypothetical protein NC120_09695 [Ruminococcus sp.]|nr:hypothetical protein [Ruminococcus sp.]
MGNGIMRFLLVLLALFILCSVSSQIYTSVREEYKTDTAVIYSSADKVSFRGVYIRNETVISKSYSGVLSFPSADGSKVANGSVIAYVYDSVEDIELNRRLNEINEEIELIKAAQNPGTVLTAQPEFISSLIGEKYQTVSTLLAKKDISDIKAQRDDLLTLMSIYQIAVKQETNYDSRIAELQAQAEQLESGITNRKTAIESPDSGYFVSYTDGFESVLSLDNTEGITAEQIKQVISGEKNSARSRPANEIGKLIKGYDWKIAGIIDNSDSVYNPGDEVKLSFASTPDTVAAVIEMLEPTEDPEEWILVLRCDEMTYDLVQKRVERVEMTLNDFEGIRVSRDALRFNKNNEKGCYVLWGQRVLFKKVDPVFEDESYILSRITSDEDYVCVYDDVIIRGVDTAAYMANSNGTEESDGEDESESFEKYSQTASDTQTSEPITFMEDDPANAGRFQEIPEAEGEDQIEPQ